MLGRRLDWALSQVPRSLKWLAIPISLLLFLQWPLRNTSKPIRARPMTWEQWLFALYVAASVVAATRAGTHLAADAVARHYRPATRRLLAHAGNLLALAPWALVHSRHGQPTHPALARPAGALPRNRQSRLLRRQIGACGYWRWASLVTIIVDLIKPRDKDEP